ncbi:MAG: TonB-dependent receptor, plug [Rhodospirillales bacterium]|nr:TonB-dependent receptor, plug [Rhodospirillales bacterium]
MVESKALGSCHKAPKRSNIESRAEEGRDIVCDTRLRIPTANQKKVAQAIVISFVALAGVATIPPVSLAQSLEDLQHMSIEDLANIEISSVLKTAQPLSNAPAAIYVVTHDDIVLSGATNIPEILRLAPNLQVAQITSSSDAISARGFNGTAASKLLVLIDGRSVYTPYHSGVFWDVQDVLPENIDRIEVISGPGAALWGANAVNGVVNIITRNSSETAGGALELGGGNLERRASLQYGGKLSDELSYRAYAETFYRADDKTASGQNARDNWNKSQGGFRVDWTPSGELITLQGDFYKGSETALTTPAEAISGQNLLAHWNHEMDDGSALQVQAYYDYSAFSVPGVASDYLSTYDLDVQYSFPWGTLQSIVWGGGYRLEKDNFPTVLSKTEPFFFSPTSRTLGLGNTFVQDSISVTDSLMLVLGAKLEDDPYSGMAVLPNARVSWRATRSDMLWAAVSRAVRAPSRLDRDLFETIGAVAVIKGGDFQSEKLDAYELGYRGQISSSASISISTFYNVYNDLRSLEFSPGGSLPIMFANGMEGNTYGLEIWGKYQVQDWWRLAGGFNWLHKNLHFKPGSSGLGGIAIAGDDPTYQLSVQSAMKLSDQVTLNLDLRNIGALPNPASPSYVELDARIIWAVSKSTEISLAGSNLLHPHHLEFGSTAAPLQLGATGVETERSFFIDTRWRF